MRFQFERLPLRSNTDEKDQLYELFDQFLKTKIYPFAKALDALIPLLKEACQMARDSARACSIFSQWSREFGDQLQLKPQWQVVDCKVADLHQQFRENHLAKHWLLPSLLPLLRVLIHEQKTREEELEEMGE